MKQLITLAFAAIIVMWGSSTHAQPHISNMSGQVTDTVNSQPVSGGVVLLYNVTRNGYPDSTLSGYFDYTYTDASGNYDSLSLGALQGSGTGTANADWHDVILVATIDCNYNMYTKTFLADTGDRNIDLNVACAPTNCQAIVDTEIDSTGNYAIYKSLLLVDAATYGNTPATQHLWSFSDNVNLSHGPLLSNNRDTVMRNLNSVPNNLEYCYQRYPSCSATRCDSGNIANFNLSCNASFYVDSVNSPNQQGRTVIVNNSSSNGNTELYSWDFGDGNSYNVENPTHTYNSTGTYNVCLTYTAIDGPDTCVSTHCEMITFNTTDVQVNTEEIIEGYIIPGSQNYFSVEGVAVFLSEPNNIHHDDIPSQRIDMTYTDSNGYYSFIRTTRLNDLLRAGAFDCYGNYRSNTVRATDSTLSNIHTFNCLPDECETRISAHVDSADNSVTFEAISLIDQSTLSFNSEHLWDFSDTSHTFTHGPLLGQNYDTIMRDLSSFNGDVEFCYLRSSQCNTPVCDSLPIADTTSPGQPLTCNAHFYVDTANSMNYQGQVVMWENSTTSAGNIVDYHWDFGDNTTYNSQYPTHTYNDTDIYNVCLTITAVDGGDTCTSTFCDSVGLDQNGNLVYKTEGEEGFTINVIDPETVGVEEASDQDPEFNLFPNPSSERATLTWNPDYNIRNIELIGMNGKLLRTLKANQSGRVEFNDLSPGIYIVRITGEDRVTPMKMIVK